ncbi:hypothetical protein CWE15_07945 [Aliidiomarina taiwanensis]|uniref:DUF3530 domain-containing protein n=1 Tax=Aliidiomarina taiwanensis TaxID=946228 RepID=A0A432X163_9GAMM|nr:DUF3530 family protein [Aliidiomarina taiwanensis]RUO40070.1 hypothetical protein CWE15_07945 [Aliidiomarina taiwanensis]
MKQSLIYLLMVSWLLGSAHASKADDLAYYLPPENTQWVEPAQEGTSAFVLLTHPSEYAIENGTVLLVSEWGLTPLQSPFVRSLSVHLPQYGWQSVAFSPPDIDLATFNWRHLGDKPYPESAPNEQLLQIKNPLQQRLLNTLEHLAAEPGVRVVVAEGLTAGLLIQLYQANALPHPEALVVVSPYLPHWQLNQALPELLAALPFPVLDLQAMNSNSWSSSTASARVIQAKRASHVQYRQRTLPYFPMRDDALAKQVFGWLRHAGVQG